MSRFSSADAPAITGCLNEFVSLSFPFFEAGLFQFASAALKFLLFNDIKPPRSRGRPSSVFPRGYAFEGGLG